MKEVGRESSQDDPRSQGCRFQISYYLWTAGLGLMTSRESTPHTVPKISGNSGISEIRNSRSPLHHHSKASPQAHLHQLVGLR